MGLVDEVGYVLLADFMNRLDGLTEGMMKIRIIIGGRNVILKLRGIVFLRIELGRQLGANTEHAVRIEEHAAQIRTRGEVEGKIPHIRYRARADLQHLAIGQYPGHAGR